MISVGQTKTLQAVEGQSTCNGNMAGNPRFAAVNSVNSWSSTNPSVATVSGGVVTAVAPGTTSILATWTAQAWAPRQGSCQNVATFNVTGSRTVKVKPTVTSIVATIPSTDSAISPGEYTTENILLEMPTQGSDLMTVFKGSDDVTVQAQGVNPVSSTSQIKWAVQRYPGDTLESGGPGLSSSSGGSTVISLTKAGNFRLIAYYDLNNNSAFDVSEELKVLRFGIVRLIVAPSQCTLSTTNEVRWRFCWPWPK